MTILTSDGDAPPHILGKRVATAVEARCAGLVCAASDVREAKQLAPRMITVVPGLRPIGSPVHDQVRSATPAEALAAGADLLVIGRAVTAAVDRQGVARTLVVNLVTGDAAPAMVRACPCRPISAEHRQAALEKAAVARRLRAELKEKLKMGSVSLGSCSRGRQRRDRREDEGPGGPGSLPGLGKVRLAG